MHQTWDGTKMSWWDDSRWFCDVSGGFGNDCCCVVLICTSCELMSEYLMLSWFHGRGVEGEVAFFLGWRNSWAGRVYLLNPVASCQSFPWTILSVSKLRALKTTGFLSAFIISGAFWVVFYFETLPFFRDLYPLKVIQLNSRPRVFTSEDGDRGRVEVKYK